MAKRFTATEKWDKVWFRKLSPDYKCFWIYITDRCNHAGIWEVDFELASMYIGMKIDPIEVSTVFKKQYTELNGGSRWFLRDFIDFQYNGNLNPLNKVHLSIINILKKEGVYKGLTRGLQAPKDMVMVKDKDMVKDYHCDTDSIKTNNNNIISRFDEVWALYPSKVGRKDAMKHFTATVKTEQDFINIKLAIENYKKSDRVKKGFIQNGSTFFNDWTGWVKSEPVNNDPLAKYEVKK